MLKISLRSYDYDLREKVSVILGYYGVVMINPVRQLSQATPLANLVPNCGECLHNAALLAGMCGGAHCKIAEELSSSWPEVWVFTGDGRLACLEFEPAFELESDEIRTRLC